MLAFACAFTMFAGAAFTDQADISQTEAVEMLAALGVIQGYEDGSFRPDDTITRAEAAKMIYTIWNGGNDDASAFVGTSNFTDVYSGYWAEGYINFCYTNGIINGVGNNQFDPDSNVTGTELAKMLLICMGYQADRSGLTGSTFSQNTNALASQNGLYDSVSVAVGSAMPRQYAAQMMYNALQADTVQWSSDSNAYTKVTTTGLEWRANADGSEGGQWVTVTKNETMGKKCMGLDTIEDVLLRSVQKENNRDTFSLNGGDYTRVATDYSDLIGLYVNIMIKDDDTSKVYGVYADEDSSVIAEGVVGQLEEDADDDTVVVLNDTDYDLDGSLDDVDVYYFNDDTALDLSSDLIANASDPAFAAWNIRLIDTDGDGDVNSATVLPVDVKKVTYVNADGIRVDGGDSYDFDDHDIYSDVAKDDWAVIVNEDYTADGKAVITQADVVSGRVGSVHTSDGNTTEIRVDGTWYKNASGENTNISAQVDLVVYNGVYFSVDGSTASLDVAVVTGVGNADSMNEVREVRLIFKDGTEEVVDVQSWDGKAYNAIDGTKDTMVAYDTDDGEYILTTISTGDIEIDGNDTDHDGVVIISSWRYDDDRAVIIAGSSTYDIDDGAMIVIKNSSDDYIYMTGAALLDRNSITFEGASDGYHGYLAVNEDGEVVALFGKTDSTISSGAATYGYIVDAYEAENSDEDTVMYIDVITEDGLLEDVETDEDYNAKYVNAIVSYTMDGDVMAIDLVKSANIRSGAIRSYTDSRVRFYAEDSSATGDSYAITSDTVIIAVSGSGDSDAEFVGQYLTEADGYSYKNAAYILDGTDVEVIFVEIDYQATFRYDN